MNPYSICMMYHPHECKYLYCISRDNTYYWLPTNNTWHNNAQNCWVDSLAKLVDDFSHAGYFSRGTYGRATGTFNLNVID